jgi:hypothetical protein
MTSSPVTFVSLSTELQQRFSLAAGEVQVIDALQVQQYATSNAFTPWPLPDVLRTLHAALEALDPAEPGPLFARHFDQVMRAWGDVHGMAAQAAPFAERTATPLRRLALDLALHTGAIGNIGKDLEPLLQMMGELLIDRDKMLKHREAQSHLRTLFAQAQEFAKRSQLLQELAGSGRNVRASLTALLDAQKAALVTIQGPLAEPWAAWQPLVQHYVESMRERPTLARHHPAVPETRRRLLALAAEALGQAEEAERLRQQAKEHMLALQRQVNLCKGWISAPAPSAPGS